MYFPSNSDLMIKDVKKDHWSEFIHFTHCQKVHVYIGIHVSVQWGIHVDEGSVKDQNLLQNHSFMTVFIQKK